MTVLSDKWIKEMVRTNNMISPFEDKQVRGNKISYGLSSFGYDARVSNEFKIFTNVNSETVDPKNFKLSSFISKKGDEKINAMIDGMNELSKSVLEVSDSVVPIAIMNAVSALLAENIEKIIDEGNNKIITSLK